MSTRTTTSMTAPMTAPMPGAPMPAAPAGPAPATIPGPRRILDVDALDVTHVEAGHRVRLLGRLDVHTVADVRTELRVAIAHGDGDLLVDMTGVELGDTTGLGVLLGAHRRAQRAGRRLVLVGVGPSLHRLLVATRLGRILHVESGGRASA